MNQEFSVVTVKKEDRIEGALKANYKTKKYGFTGTFGSTGLVSKLLFAHSTHLKLAGSAVW